MYKLRLVPLSADIISTFYLVDCENVISEILNAKFCAIILLYFLIFREGVSQYLRRTELPLLLQRSLLIPLLTLFLR